MKRRNFILSTCLGIGFAAIAGYSYFADGEKVGRNRQAMQSINTDLPEDAAKILYLASLAPSGHNTQPWKIRVKEPYIWIICSDRKHWLPAVDAENQELLLAMGAFLENLTIAARYYGYDTECDILANNAFAEDLAEVRFIPAVKAVGLTEYIAQRRVLRKNFHNDDLAAADKENLLAGDADLIYVPLQSEQGQAISQAVIEGGTIEANSYEAGEELGKWIRWNNSEEQQYQNGLTADSMEMGIMLKWYMQHFMDKATVHSDMFIEQSIATLKEQAVNGAGWIIFKNTGYEVTDFIAAGRRLERVWLQATRQRIAVHPMSQAFSRAKGREELASLCGSERPIQFMMRVGYIDKYPQPVSLRMDMDKLIVKG